MLKVCDRLLVWCTAALDVHTIRRAWLIEAATDYQWFDCLLLASALISGCRFFLSEDLQDGRLVDDLRIVDPFRFSPSQGLPSE